MMSVISTLFLLILTGSNALEFPPAVKLCKKTEEECLKKAFVDVLTVFAEGSKQYGVPKIEPFTTMEIRIAGNGGAIDLEQIYHDAKIHRLSHLIPDEIKITEQGSELTFDIKVHADSVSMVSTYEAKGKMLLFQINGGGFGNLTLENPTATLRVVCDTVDKGGEKYLKAKSMDLELQRCNLIVDYKNLINNNKELSRTVLDAMNANSDDVFNYLKKDYSNMLSVSLKSIAEGVLSKIPVKNLFLE